MIVPFNVKALSVRLYAAFLLLTALCVDGEDEVGYYITSGNEALVATCSAAAQRWSSISDSTGVCVHTEAGEDDALSTTYYYRGEQCIGSTASGYFIAYRDDITASVTVDFPCVTCATVTILEEFPSASPSLLFIGCPDQIGLPFDAETVYRRLPSGFTTAAPEPGASSDSQIPSSTTTSPPLTSTSTSTSTSGGDGADVTDSSDGSGGGPDTAVIVGAVLGSVIGLALLVLAFFLGRRCASRISKHRATYQVREPYEEKPELAGSGDGVKGPQYTIIDQYPQTQLELASNFPAAHQLPTERGPYEMADQSHEHSSRPQ